MNKYTNDNDVTAIDTKALGRRIREERERLGLTRADFAEMVEMSDYYIGQMERGERKMSLQALVKIASILHVSMDYLVYGTSRYKSQPTQEDSILSFTNEDIQALDMIRLIENCSQKELELIKKLIQTVIPYTRQIN